jgi:hypothetical protein
MGTFELAELETDFLAIEIMFHQKESGEMVDYDKARQEAARTIREDRLEEKGEL